jgi:hypothetical protein
LKNICYQGLDRMTPPFFNLKTCIFVDDV